MQRVKITLTATRIVEIDDLIETGMYDEHLDDEGNLILDYAFLRSVEQEISEAPADHVDECRVRDITITAESVK